MIEHANAEDERRAPEAYYSNAGPPIAYSPVLAIPDNDPLLTRLTRVHGRDPRRRADDLTDALAKAASSNVRTG